MKVTVIIVVSGTFGTDTKGSGGLGNKRTCEDHPNYYITENGHNTEKSPGDLRRLALTQIPVKDF